MAELLEDAQGTLESTTIWVNRTAATVKGGRRFSFCALVAVGDRRGNVGLGYGKAPGVPAAIEKAQKAAKKDLVKVDLNKGTITHQVNARYLSSNVRLIPASPGTGVIAGATVRAVLELAGISDCLTKSYGSNNKLNLAKATLEGLKALRARATIAQLRGVTIEKTVVDEKIEQGEKFAPSAAASDAPKAKAPVNVKDEKARSSRGGRKGGGRGRGGGGGGGGGRGRSRGGDAQQSPGDQRQAGQAQVAQAPAEQQDTRPAEQSSGGGEETKQQ